MSNYVHSDMPLDSLPSGSYGNAEIYEITNEYDWTMAPKKGRKLIPSMILTQYELDANAVFTNLKFWFNAMASARVEGDKRNPYKGLYVAKKTGVEFHFPWLEEYHHNISQNWEDYKGIENTELAEKLLKGWQAINDSPGVAVNTPRVWKGGSRGTIPYKITLFNTTKNPTTSIKRNRKLINRLIASTLHDQKGYVLATPPALYSVVIPGVRYSPACVISQFEVSNIGVIVNKKGLGAIPEAWEIKFSITELVNESRQIFNGSIDETNRVSAIIDTDSEEYNEQSTAAKLLDASTEATKNLSEGAQEAIIKR